MDEQTKNNHLWLDPLIQKMSQNLGIDSKNVHYKVTTPRTAHYLADLVLVEIITNGHENAKKMAVVVKRPSTVPEVRELLKTDIQFHNEILFYTRYTKNCKEFPRCFFVEEEPPVDSVIVLENVIEQRGYRMCESKFHVPLDYTLAAFRAIARFHAKAYAAKEHQKEEFFDFIKNIQEDRFDPDSLLKITVNGTASRSVEYLREQGYDQRFCDEMDALFENAYDNVLLKTLKPEEPLAVLCHGDFTINNMMFKRKDGELVALLLDFATIRYGSPTVDLSTFLCLHCTKNLDKETLNNILEVYHDSLIKCLEENDVDCTKYSYKALLEDFKKNALYGFFIATFFLAVQMGKTSMKPEDYIKLDIAVLTKLMREAGGDEVSEILAGILLKLKEFGCLDWYIDY